MENREHMLDKLLFLSLSTARTLIRLSILVTPNNTIGGYTETSPPPSLPFNPSNYIFASFISLFPQAFCSLTLPLSD